MFNKIFHHFGDNQFYNALKVTFCAALAFLIFYHTQGASAAFSVMLGAMLVTPVDISSNLKHKIIGLLVAAVLLPTFSVVLTTTYAINALFFPLFSILVFFSALISLFGYRANLLSFTLLIGISLSFIHHDKPEDALQNGLYMFLGGIIYMLTSLLFYIIKPTRYINLEVAHGLILSAIIWPYALKNGKKVLI